MTINLTNSIKDCVGLKNDFINKVFVCPECKSEFTISKFQLNGEKDIYCGRCNAKWCVKDDGILDLNSTEDIFFADSKVYFKLDEAQKPKEDSPQPEATQTKSE